MASNVVSDNFETGTGGVPQLGGADRQTQWCKAWVNFNGTGTVAIRDSYNVSSVTDNGTGDYTVYFTNTMPNNNYSFTASSGTDGTGYSTSRVVMGNYSYQTTTYIRLSVKESTTTANSDMARVTLQIFSN